MKDEGDDNVVTYGLNVEGHVVPGKTIVGKRLVIGVAAVLVAIAIPAWLQRDSVECGVVDVDSTHIEISCVEITLALDDGAGEAGVAGAVGGFDHDDCMRRGRRGARSYANGGGPSSDGAIDSREKKIGGRVCSKEKVRRAGVGDGACGSARGKCLVVGISFRNGHD